MARLQFTDSTGAREVELRPERQSYKVGRATGCEVQITMNGISRQHAEVTWDARSQAWSVVDLNSANGTWVNGNRCPSKVLAHGDEMLIGECRVWFQDPRPVTRTAAPPPPPPPAGARTPTVTTGARAVVPPAAPLLGPSASSPTQRVDSATAARGPDLEALRASVERITQERDQLQRRVATLAQEVQALRGDLASAPDDAMYADVQRQLGIEQRERARAEAVSAQLREQLEALRSQFEELRHAPQHAAIVPIPATQSAEIDAITAENARLHRQVQDLVHGQDAWRAEREELLAQLEDHHQADIRRSGAMPSVTPVPHEPRADLLETELQAAHLRIRTLDAERQQFAIEIDDLRHALQQRPDPEAFAALQQQVESLHSELRQRPTADDIESLRSRITTLSEALRARDLELQAQQQHARTAAAEAADAEARMGELAAQLQSLAATIDAARQQVVAPFARLGEAVRDLQGQLTVPAPSERS